MDLDREALLQLYDSLEAVLEQPGPEAEVAFRASLANVQGGLDETNDEALDVALRTVRRTLHRGQPPTLPPALSQREDWSELLSEIGTLQRFILTLGKGDLKQSLPLRGLMAGGLKALQANLRHLTWQTQQIAKGDFDQRVDFMGEFSTAFNKMVRALKESQADLQRRERELSQANADLRREIADRRQIEEALQASLERYDELVARIPVGIYVIWLLPDDAMKFQYVSDRWCDIHQVNRDAVLADASVANALIHPEDLDAFLARNQEALRSREPFSWEGRFVIGDEIRWLQIESTPEVMQDGNVRWFGVTQDITERKRAEAALKRANEEAEEARRVAEAANQAKSAFLAKMSHELRTPMSAVLGFSELMTNDPNLTADQRENLNIIRHSGEHLLALINDVLDFSKIEAGKADVQPETFDLHRTLRSLEEMFSLRAKRKGLTVNVDLASDIPRYIRADEGKLRQVLINLLSNAVKFVEEGTVTMSVSEHKRTKMDGPEADVANPRSTVLHFEIEDTGVGIAPDELERVFEAFEQTQSGHQSKQGTGLGLPISREYVQMMGGELKVTSEVGVGSCFSFDIPVDVMEADEIEERHIARQVVGLVPGQPTYKLLLVDDMRVSRMLLVKLLRPLGFDVREAADGREALEVWQAWRPDFIFMDLRMPEMNGREATRRIRAQSDDREVVIVALTAMVFEEEREAILAAGCDDIIHKPILTDAIFSTLEEYLGVEFIYEEPGEQPEKASASPEHITLDVTLDSAWVKEMRQATIEGDIQWMDRLIAHIRETNPAVAEKLTGLAYDFAHGEILDWLGDAAS